MTRYKIILNPTSNKGAAAALAPEIEQELMKHNLDFELVTTQYAGHALELSQTAARNRFDAVIAAGGDGTANEVINGLMFSRNGGKGSAALGVLPVGRGNDFNYSMGNTEDWRAAVGVLAAGNKRWIDIGRVTGGLYPEGRYFGNGVGIGFDAVVGFIAAKQRITGFMGYLLAALKTMYVYSPAPVVQVEMENETITQPSLMVTVMNGRRLGGGFMIAPDGNPSDGTLDVCFARQVSRLKILYLITKFMKGTQYSHPAIQGRKITGAMIRAVEGTLPVHADGETIATECPEIHIELLPHQLEMYLPV